jgi:hypothetical protein
MSIPGSALASTLFKAQLPSVPGVINLGLAALSTFINLVPSNSIGGISVDATLEEIGTDLLQITEHPVEAGANITDHSFYRPAELVMHCGWSNANIKAALGVSGNQPFAGGALNNDDYVSSVYSQLISLQQSLQPFHVFTTIRQYSNMLITSLSLTRDKKTSQALMITVTMRQIITVSTLSSTIAPAANQLNPASTSETVNYGAQSLINNPVPSPQGSLPPVNWRPPLL